MRGPAWEGLAGHLRPEAGLLRLRKELGVFANIRPIRSRPTLYLQTPYRDQILHNVDIVLIRELTGGLYFGEKGYSDGSAFDICRYSVDEITRITRVAAEIARKRQKKLTSIDKANVLETSRLWRKTVTRVMAEEFADIKVEHILVDAAAMYLATRPSSFDVLLTENMFGDILSDQASTLAGSLGLLPSASLDGGGRGLFEPVHGSAPDIAGKQVANPLGTILSVAMMLRYSLAREDLASRIENAVELTIEGGRLTPDLAPALGGKLTETVKTDDITRRVCAFLQER